jgi:hypothetical protein
MKMSLLFRLLYFAFFIWIVCYFFYSLGKRKSLENQQEEYKNKHRRRKVVESTAVGRENNGR